MMHTRKNIIFISVLILLSALLYTTALANDQDDHVTFAATVEIEADDLEELAAAGARVFISGNVLEDMLVAGATVDIDADTGGDLHAVGARLNLRGDVDGEARVAGAEVMVDSNIGQELDAFAASLVVTENAVIGGKTSLAGAVVEFHGKADGDLKIYADEIVLEGEIADSAFIEARSVSISENVIIGENITIRSVEETVLPEAIQVGGTRDISQISEEEYLEMQDMEEGFFSDFSGKLVIGASAFILGLLFILFTGNTTDQMTNMLRAHPGRSLLWGLAIFIGLPIFIFICLVTVIGVPIGLSSLFTIPFLTLLGFTAAILTLSDLLLSKSGQPKETKQRILFLALSVLIYYLIRLIPVVGFIIVFIAMLFGLGAAIVTLGERIKGSDASQSNALGPDILPTPGL